MIYHVLVVQYHASIPRGGEEETTRSVAAEEGLRLLQRIDLPSASLLADLEVLQQEVARPVQARNVLTQSHQVRGSRGLVLLGRAKIALKTGLLALLLGDRLAVRRTLL